MALGLGLGLQFNRFSGGGFDSDYQAVLDYATSQGYTLPSDAQQILQNNLVIALKAGGIWAKLDSFSVFATNGNIDFALIDWIQLRTMTAVSSPTFTTNLGIQTNGTSSYINTLFSGANDGVNYLTDTASFGWWANAPDISGSEISGARDGTALNLSYIVNPTTSLINSDAFAILFASNTNNGLWHMNRTNATDIQRIVNGVSSGNITSASEGPTIQPFYLGALNGSGTAITFDPNTFKVFFAGGDLLTESADLYTAINTYITAL